MWRRTSSAIYLAQGKAVMTSTCCEGFSRASWAARAAKSTPVTFRSQVTTTLETSTTTTTTATDADTAVKRLFDVDCNLTHEAFAKIGVERAIHAARNEGVEAMLVPGSDVESSREAQCLAAQDNLAGVRILYTAGVHPYEASKEPDASISASLRSVRELAHGAAAIGECGLDFSEGFPEAESQLAWFAPQVALACELKKPLFLHERLAHTAFLEVLDHFSTTLPPAIVHCFTGTASELQAYLDRGFYISVSGLICREQAGKGLREALAQVRPPLDRIMVETDAPYLGFPGCQASLVPSEATPKERKKILKAVSPNVPASLPLVVEALAKTLNMDANRLAQASFNNANRFFSQGS